MLEAHPNSEGHYNSSEQRETLTVYRKSYSEKRRPLFKLDKLYFSKLGEITP